MSDIKIYLDLSEEIQQLLADNGITIEDILRHENIDVSDVKKGVMPQNCGENNRDKGLVTFILASSFLLAKIGCAISTALNSSSGKTVNESKEHLGKDVVIFKFTLEVTINKQDSTR